MDCYDASLLKMKIIDVYGDGNKQLIGQEFYCLKSIQIQQNKYNKTKLKYDIHGCDYSSSYSGVSLQQCPMLGISNEDLYIGRANSNHIVLSDLSISKQHVIITYDAHVGCFITDLNSKHGTYINDERIIVDESRRSSAEPNDLGIQACQDHFRSDKAVTVVDESNIDTDQTENHEGSDLALCKSIANQRRQLLKIGMIIRFGRIVCEVFRKQQNQVLCSSFQPCHNNKPIAKADALPCVIQSTRQVDVSMDTTTQHKLAVTQRIQALLTTINPLTITLFDPISTLSNSRKGKCNDTKTASIKRKRNRNGLRLASNGDAQGGCDDRVNGYHDDHDDNCDVNKNDINNKVDGNEKILNKDYPVDVCIDRNIDPVNHHNYQ